jgi:cell division protein FtsB
VTKRQKITLMVVFIAMFNLLLVVIFGDNGLIELKRLQRQHADLVQENTSLNQENARMYSGIDRLKNDPDYIENIARQELGMIRSDELIFKFKDDTKPR